MCASVSLLVSSFRHSNRPAPRPLPLPLPLPLSFPLSARFAFCVLRFAFCILCVVCLLSTLIMACIDIDRNHMPGVELRIETVCLCVDLLISALSAVSLLSFSVLRCRFSFDFGYFLSFLNFCLTHRVWMESNESFVKTNSVFTVETSRAPASHGID